jgi:hypothetical protein
MKRKSDKADITIMTLLAHEATSDARKLLKSYGMPDAKSHNDLEVKLSELYVNTPNKIDLEKKLADIHPHKKFILKYNQPKVVDEVNVEKTSNMVDDDCPTTLTPSYERRSNVEGETQPRKYSPIEMYIGPAMLVVLVGITLGFTLKMVGTRK